MIRISRQSRELALAAIRAGAPLAAVSDISGLGRQFVRDCWLHSIARSDGLETPDHLTRAHLAFGDGLRRAWAEWVVATMGKGDPALMTMFKFGWKSSFWSPEVGPESDVGKWNAYAERGISESETEAAENVRLARLSDRLPEDLREQLEGMEED